jgi:NADH dehydrogenase
MPPTKISTPHRVVIVGGGFGGLHAARALAKSDVAVTLLDRSNYHLFQPLLYQVATGALSPANIAAPLRAILRRQANVTVMQADVVGFQLDRAQVLLRDDAVYDKALEFDSLIVAAGATHSYFGHDQWAARAPGLKSIEDATEIRARVLRAFERAEQTDDLDECQRLLTFVIIGAGPTGVELAGALAELSRHALRYDFRRIQPEQAKILLVDASPRVLGMYPEELSDKAEASLARLGVTVITGRAVQEISRQGVILEHQGQQTTIQAETVLWAAGVKASPLAQLLAAAAAAQTDRQGKIVVQSDFSLPGFPHVFAIGDMAHAKDDQGKPLPGVAPVAIQQGRYVADLIASRLRGTSIKPFRYRDYGSMATIGRSMAVAKIGRWKFAGVFAWLTWLFVHLMQLVSFENRVLVLLQWMWNYFTRNRSARLITGKQLGSAAVPDQSPREA